MARVRDIDKGFKQLKASMIRGDGLKAQAGIQGASATAPHGDFGLRNIDIAVFNEFGTITSPERSFVRATFDRERKKYGKMMDSVVKLGLDGNRMNVAFTRLALLMAADMRRTIDQSIDLEPLAESTIRKRLRRAGAVASTERPLLDTGQLKRSITGVVTK